ncbi:MAG: type IV pilus assembly protein PilM [Candidatus Portnoybacteria bacterium]|nr:type IV pilus assembly protein PilM [Candidatus Portnoybacteria bacterium]
MFLNKSSAFGLDLSDLSIKLAWLKKSGGKIKFASFGRQEISSGVIEEGKIKKEAELIDLIKKAVSQTKGEKIKTRFCVASLPETESYIRVVQLPKMKQEEMAEAIKWELEANIPVSVNDVYFDWQIIQNNFNEKDHSDILIGALPKTLVDPYLSAIRKAGLEPLVFEIESVATGRALIKKEAWSEPLMIIDLGAKRTCFILWAGASIWFTSSVPISNNLLIDDIAKALQVPYDKAKDLKFKTGLDEAGKEDGKIYSALEPRLLELVGETRKYLDYYKTAIAPRCKEQCCIKKILLCGGGANLKGLPVFLSSRLKLEVAIGNPWVNIFQADNKNLPRLSFSDSLAYTTSLGLALRGLEAQ